MKKLVFLSLCASLFSAASSAPAQSTAAASPAIVRSAARNAGLSELLWLLKNLAQKQDINLEQEDDYYQTILRRNITAETVKTANFRIRLRLETEPLLGTQYRQSETDGSWGHGYHNSYKFAQAENIPWDVENAFEFPDVPPRLWPYEAMRKLGEAGVIEWNEGTNNRNKATTRYEFAVTVTRLFLKKDSAEKQKQAPFQVGPARNLPDDKFLEAIEREENRLLIEKLKEEFLPEMRKLVGPDIEKRYSSLFKNTENARPHYVYLHLGFAYGTNIDPRLVADVKSLIESYCAASLKAQQ